MVLEATGKAAIQSKTVLSGLVSVVSGIATLLVAFHVLPDAITPAVINVLTGIGVTTVGAGITTVVGRVQATQKIDTVLPEKPNLT